MVGFLMPLFAFRDFVSHFVDQDKVTEECMWAPWASCELNLPQGSPLELLSVLCVSDSAQQSKTTVAALMAEWSVLICHP